jgi:hypothetical protein
LEFDFGHLARETGGEMADLDERVLRERRLQRGGEVCSAVSNVLASTF